MTPKKSTSLTCLSLLLMLAFAGRLAAQTEAPSLPHLEHKEGRHAFIVDGAPFLMLGAQCHNSSAWPMTLPKVWSVIEMLHANTLEIPIYWEQFEPEQGKYDTTLVDKIISDAREHKVRLVLLWFATWKNGSSHYLPLWMKQQPELYPRIIGKDGSRVDSPSPHAPALLEADTRAFTAFMRHLKETDSQRTVIMVQVQNEPGAWNTVRDYSPAAQKLFAAPVPKELLVARGLTGKAGGDWATVFGRDADEFFHAWHVARFIGQVAAAGKAEYPLPMYVNAALRDPLTQPVAGTYESGGPTDNVLDIWKVAAPAIDVLSPDIYMDDSAHYLKVLDLYSRPDNPLFVPETIGSAKVSRYCFSAIARGAIGWAPFGVDSTRSGMTQEAVSEPVALTYRMLSPMMRELAKWNFEGRVFAAVEEQDDPRQTLSLGRWQATATFGPQTFGFGKTPKGNPEPVGRLLVVKLGENEFILTGYLCRVDFKAVGAADATAQREFLRVEEGSFEGGAFQPKRILNGDETDWGLNFGATPVILRVKLGTY